MVCLLVISQFFFSLAQKKNLKNKNVSRLGQLSFRLARLKNFKHVRKKKKREKNSVSANARLNCVTQKICFCSFICISFYFIYFVHYIAFRSDQKCAKGNKVLLNIPAKRRRRQHTHDSKMGINRSSISCSSSSSSIKSDPNYDSVMIDLSNSNLNDINTLNLLQKQQQQRHS